MTTGHLFYIPLILLVGLVLGLIIGRRSALVALEEEERRRQLAARRAARAATPDAAPAPTEPTGTDP